ncbi:MAG: hypothetical protein ACXVRH_13255, partial [Thermoleophilaceae bacterium]
DAKTSVARATVLRRTLDRGPRRRQGELVAVSAESAMSTWSVSGATMQLGPERTLDVIVTATPGPSRRAGGVDIPPCGSYGRGLNLRSPRAQRRPDRALG